MSDPDAARTANQLGALALVAVDRIRERTGLELTVAAALLTLQTITAGGSVDDLRRVLGLTHSGGVRLVKRLREAELVRQDPDPADARASVLRLTRRGHAAARRVTAARLDVLKQLMAPLTARQQSQLEATLMTMLDAVPADRAGARRTCRLCSPDVCGHPERCPVTLGADRHAG